MNNHRSRGKRHPFWSISFAITLIIACIIVSQNSCRGQSNYTDMLQHQEDYTYNDIISAHDSFFVKYQKPHSKGDEWLSDSNEVKKEWKQNEHKIKLNPRDNGYYTYWEKVYEDYKYSNAPFVQPDGTVFSKEEHLKLWKKQK